jgi:hypothetical protein
VVRLLDSGKGKKNRRNTNNFNKIASKVGDLVGNISANMANAASSYKVVTVVVVHNSSTLCAYMCMYLPMYRMQGGPHFHEMSMNRGCCTSVFDRIMYIYIYIYIMYIELCTCMC